MKYLLLIPLLIISNAHGMEEPPLNEQAKQIISYAQSRIKQHANQNLIAIAKTQNQTDLIHALKAYYCSQPKNQTSVWAYLRQPVVNTKKTLAYLQILRASSGYVRKKADATLSPEELENDPIDSHMWAYTKEVWPLVSIQYELKDLENHVNASYSWAQRGLTYCSSLNHPKVRAALDALQNDSRALNKAIETCQQSVIDAYRVVKIQEPQK